MDRCWVLLGKKNSGEASPEELMELEGLLSGSAYGVTAGEAPDPATQEVLERVWVAPMQSVPETSPHRNVWNRIQKSVHIGEGRVIGWRKWAVAASILLLCGSAVWYYLSGPARRAVQGAGAATLNQVATQAGSKTRVELPDGTQVWLNGNSLITYGNQRFGTEEREVTLVGEAYFDVAKNEKIPFVIHTRDITIRVLGTAFSVRAYPKEKTVETALIRGLVEVTTRQDPERKIILKPAEKLIVPVEPPSGEVHEPAAQAAAASPYSIMKLKKDTTVETVWTRSRLEFDNEMLEDLAPKMEVWYHVRIHFGDEAIRKRRFSGVIEKESLVQTLEAMKLSGHFTYQIKENELWLREN